MKYKIVKNNRRFTIVEIATTQTIDSFSTEKEAKKFMRHLNSGGGFDGWSPTFIAKKVAYI
jgi:hypothetical protein